MPPPTSGFGGKLNKGGFGMSSRDKVVALASLVIVTVGFAYVLAVTNFSTREWIGMAIITGVGVTVGLSPGLLRLWRQRRKKGS